MKKRKKNVAKVYIFMRLYKLFISFYIIYLMKYLYNI